MPMCRIVPQVEIENDGLNGSKPVRNALPAQMVFWDQDMTVRELVRDLEDFSFVRGRHGVTFDQGVRRFLLDALKSHLPRKHEAAT